MRNLEKYLGRYVRLEQQAFQRIAANRNPRAGHLENHFLVAAVDRRMRRLICYGANRRVDARADEIVLV
ncbi:hypothetical protein [Propionivibrio sp.]|jgi:hypothetical protein|uniref:hypothetical protein n=1 Tax=Propionivibrio sp. TaxID=2212460 RepID=UPI0039E71A91